MSVFASRLIQRLTKIDTHHVESFLTQLVKEKNIQRAIFDSLHEGIILADHHLKVRYANETILGLLGLGKKKVLGQPLRRLFRIEALQFWVDEFERNGEPISDLEIPIRTPAPRVYSLNVVPLKSEDGGISHSIWLLQDQTDSHRRAAEKQQLESLRSLSALTAGIAHEIKNPLNSLGIHAQLLQQGCRELARTPELADSPQVARLQHSSQVFREELDRLGRIVEQFLQAVRPVRLNVQPTQVNAVLKSIVALMEPEFNERHVRLHQDFDPVLPSIKADTFQLQQALLNIIKNALEAIPEGETDGVVILRTQAKPDFLLIEIEDNGVGISEADHLKIFEPYNTTKPQGTGLGLMVVYRIINAHRGAIGLDSEPGRGTIFRVALPLDEKPTRLLAEETAGSSPVLLPETTPNP